MCIKHGGLCWWCLRSGLVPPAPSFLLVVLLSPSCAALTLPQASLQTTTQAGAKCVCLCVTEATLGKEEPWSMPCCDGPSQCLLLPHPCAEPPSPSAALGPWCIVLFVACCHGIRDCENSYYVVKSQGKFDTYNYKPQGRTTLICTGVFLLITSETCL